MLNQRQALAKLRAELEGRERRLYRQYGWFGHLAQNCSSGKEQKEKRVAGNKFKVLKSKVMQCGIFIEFSSFSHNVNRDGKGNLKFVL